MDFLGFTSEYKACYGSQTIWKSFKALPEATRRQTKQGYGAESS